jgi:hypothetical protein
MGSVYGACRPNVVVCEVPDRPLKISGSQFMSLSNYLSRRAYRFSVWAGPVGQLWHNDLVRVQLDSEPVTSNE